ncbi:MAG: PaaI family thioesterase [Sulfobacillus sp.]
MQLVDDRGCLICGADNPIGLQVHFEVDDGRCSARLVLPELVQGWRQVAHGGVVSALLDEAMFYALAEAGWRGMTAQMTVRFLKPVPLGVELSLTAERTQLHRRLGRAKSRLCHGDDVLAEAEGTFLATRQEGSSR